MARISFIILCILCLSKAGYAVIGYAFFPLGHFIDAPLASFDASKFGVYTHVFCSAVAIGLGPFQFLDRLRIRYPTLHNRLGRLYLGVGVLGGGLSGLYLSFHASGGPVGRAAFTVLAIYWLYSGYRAYFAIRKRNVAAHRRWMFRNFALTLTALTQRFFIMILDPVMAFEVYYMFVAWLAIILNLTIAERFLKRPTYRF